MTGSIFDRDPRTYDTVRPGYPPALVDDVIVLSRIAPGGRAVWAE